MSLREFDNGYWYAAELKKFAKEIGIAHAGKLRKDELEQLCQLASARCHPMVTTVAYPVIGHGIESASNR